MEKFKISKHARFGFKFNDRRPARGCNRLKSPLAFDLQAMRCAASKFKYSNFIALLRASIKIFCGFLNLPLCAAVLFAGVKKSSHIDAPGCSSFIFLSMPPAVAREAAVRAYDAVAWDDD